MFGKKVQPDVKKSTQKFLDLKKDTSTRLKHLRIVIDNADGEELAELFNSQNKQIYYLVRECIAAAETNFRQREPRFTSVVKVFNNSLTGKSPYDLTFHLVHKAHREELDSALLVLEKLLLHLPELLGKGWQQNALLHTLTKLLHLGNSPRLRKDAVRYFIIWYQSLGESAPKEVDAVFATLVPGFPSPHSGLGLPPSPLPSVRGAATSASAVFHDSPTTPTDMAPVLPPQSGEKPIDDPACFYLEVLLNSMVSQVGKLEWREKFCRAHKSFSFLLDRFRTFYLPHIFPGWSGLTSLYPPLLELPTPRKQTAEDAAGRDAMLSCRVCLIKWVASFTHVQRKETPVGASGAPSSFSNSSMTPDGEGGRVSVVTPVAGLLTETHHEDMAVATVREVLYSTRHNVNFVIEIYRQAFLLPFTHAHAIRKAISVYKDWIQINYPDVPPFLLEPVEGSDVSGAGVRLRNDSYLGAVHRDGLVVRAGLQPTLQLFVTHAASVFLLTLRSSAMLEEQVDTCKRVLNIYRYMVMQTRMEQNTWEQLLSVLLHVTSLVLTRTPPKRKEDTLGGKLAPAIFQTLIVTWIKANLNVVISPELWDQFLAVLVSLTQWEELIREWAKTLETLTRVLARHVYQLDLNDLPLDRLSEQQTKKRRGTKSQMDAPQGSHRRSTRVTKLHTAPAHDVTPDTSGSFQMCGTRKRVDSTGEYREYLPFSQGSQPPRRCYSDTNLSRKRQRRSTRQCPAHTATTPTQASFSETDGARISRPRRCRSLDSLRPDESPLATRSPSPAPSSNMESSIKDSPMGLDFVTGDSSSIGEGGETAEGTEGRSVMAGGCVRGWLPDVAVVLWRRMLSALGDVNRLPDPALHAHVFDHLVLLWDTLARIHANQGVPEEGLSLDPPLFAPPLTLLAPWCLKALELPDSYQRGKLSAYRLLCRMTLAAPAELQATAVLPHLYRSLHAGLASPSPHVVNTVLRCLGPRFLSRQVPGYSLLLLDLISSANSVLESPELQSTPRVEAASVLASVLSLPLMTSQAWCLDPRSPTPATLTCGNALDVVLGSLLRAARHEPTGVARCITISALAVFLYSELPKSSSHPAVTDALNIILRALTFRQKSVGLLACDLLFALVDHVAVMETRAPSLPARVIRVCSHVLGAMGPNGGPLGASLALTLAEWVMRVPMHRLLAPDRPDSLILSVLQVLYDVGNGQTSSVPLPDDFEVELPAEWENSVKVNDLRSPKKLNPHSEKQCGILAAKAVLMHLVSHLGHFPMGLGASRLSALVQENDDVPALGSDLSPKLFTAPNVQMLVVRNRLMSLVEVAALAAPGGGVTAGLVTGSMQARVILRDLVNKASWDASQVFCSPHDLPAARRVPPSNPRPAPGRTDEVPMSLMVAAGLPRGTLRHRPPHVLPAYLNAAPDMDNVHDLLRYIGHTSPECLDNQEEELCEPAPPPAPLTRSAEAEVISAVLAQRNVETEYIHHCGDTVEPCIAPVHTSPRASFHNCRSLVSQLGLDGWERRSQVHLLQRSERLLRELRNLDRQRGRETHKMAVIYVANGQEDKNSILSNRGGSQAFEQFVAGLAWEVELATHTGFMGGLASGCGETAPYYASAFIETLFHVSTRMPSHTEEALLQKMRHLGNDEVHIVWSEHHRDYRRSSLPTEFCDVLIVIYPLPDSLYRITVDTKSEIPVFGPLWNEAVVEGAALAGLVRATAIAASRAQRRTLNHYRPFYEERAQSLQTVVSTLKDPKSFEDFAAAVFSPVSPTSNPSKPSTSDNRVWERVSPQQPKKLTFRSEPDSPVLSRAK